MHWPGVGLGEKGSDAPADNLGFVPGRNDDRDSCPNSRAARQREETAYQPESTLAQNKPYPYQQRDHSGNDGKHKSARLFNRKGRKKEKAALSLLNITAYRKCNPSRCDDR
jgi:hypothetical protein